MATFTQAASLVTTVDGKSFDLGPITPVNGDLLVLVLLGTGSTEVPQVNGVGPDGPVEFTASSLSNTTRQVWVSNRRVRAVPITVQVRYYSSQSTGLIARLLQLTGMTKAGASAFRQNAAASGSGATVPTINFTIAPLTSNPVLACVRNGTNPATLTEPAGWTENVDSGFATPTTGGEVALKDSGFVSTQVLYASVSASSWGATIVEFDASVPATVGDPGVSTTEAQTWVGNYPYPNSGIRIKQFPKASTIPDPAGYLPI